MIPAILILQGLHFTGEISLGNVVTIIVGISAILAAWRDMDWRVKNAENQLRDHDVIEAAHSKILYEMREGNSELREIVKGQERRLRMLEEWHHVE